MDIQDSLRHRTLNRQVYVQRKNLVQICRFAVKSLIDKASLATVDDECEEVTNFCAVLEQLLSHRLKAQKTWFAMDENMSSSWGYVKVACKKVPNNCINSISNLENVKSPMAKGRAWIRCVLMEKRLSEYLSVALQQTSITRKFYQEGAIMLTEDANMLNGILLGLNAIDFSFCLKGKNAALTCLTSPVEIDYSPYLRFQQSQESLHSDAEELHELSTISSMTSSIMSEDVTNVGEDIWQFKYKALEAKYKTVSEQKGYLEELGRLREQQLYQLQHQRQTLINTVHQYDVEGRKERHQLELVILELQKQLTSMKRQYEIQNQKYTTLMRKLQGSHLDMDDVTIISSPSSQGQSASDSRSSSDAGSTVPVSAARFAIPGTSGQPATANTQKEDTQSMIAMAGSFSSQASSDTFHSQHTMAEARPHLQVVSADRRRGSSELNTPEKRGDKLGQYRGDNSEINAPNMTGHKQESAATGGDYSGTVLVNRDRIGINKSGLKEEIQINHQQDVNLSSKEEEFVMVPEQAQEASALIDTESDQSEIRIQSDTNQSEDCLLTCNAPLDSGNPSQDSHDIANQNIPDSQDQIGELSEEAAGGKDGEKDGTSTESDDIMVLSDVSLTDTDGSSDK